MDSELRVDLRLVLPVAFGSRVAGLSHRSLSVATWALVCISFVFTQTSSAQTSPAMLPDLKLSAGGVVRSLVFQPDGRIIIGGTFSSVNDVPRKSVARLEVNGAPDTTW